MTLPSRLSQVKTATRFRSSQSHALSKWTVKSTRMAPTIPSFGVKPTLSWRVMEEPSLYSVWDLQLLSVDSCWPLISPPRANLTGTNLLSQRPILMGLFDHTETFKKFQNFFFKKIIKFPRFDWAVTSIEVSSLKIEVACEFTVMGITFSNFACPLPPTRPKHPYKLMGWWFNFLCLFVILLAFRVIFWNINCNFFII